MIALISTYSGRTIRAFDSIEKAISHWFAFTRIEVDGVPLNGTFGHYVFSHGYMIESCPFCEQQ
jgi:hypothetical protein